MTTTDPYVLCITALMTEVRKLTTYFTKDENVTFDKPTVARGGDYWFVVTPQGYSYSRYDATNRLYIWRTLGELAVRYKEYNTRTQKAIEARGAVERLLSKPHLIKDLNVKSIDVVGDDLRQDVQPGLTPNFLIYPFKITINQIVNIRRTTT